MRKIAPSILSADFANLEREIREVVQGGADLIHVDVMDGHFVPNITIGPGVLKAIRGVTSCPLDVHLMIEEPQRHIDAFVEGGADLLTVHVEACPHLHRVIQRIREGGVKVGVALNPATPLSSVEEVIGEVDLILIMTVNPGAAGQELIPFTLDKVRRLRRMIDERGSKVQIEVDGGVKVENIGEVARSGADILVAGSAIFDAEDRAGVIKRMRREIEGMV